VLSLESSGTVKSAMVTAERPAAGEALTGSASGDIRFDDDLQECLEYLAVEAMLEATQTRLDDSPSVRRLGVVSSHF
jgi:hypothetical protein